jgi:HSP20 family protein
MNGLQKRSQIRSGWDPFREMEEMQNRMAALFGRRLPLRDGGEEGIALTEWSPAVDIEEDDKEYTIKAELPGVRKEDVRVTVESGVLTISGERKEEREEKEEKKKYHRIERFYGTFTRSFTPPEGVAGDKVSAESKDGILRVHLPKDEKAMPRSIDVKVG